MKENGFSLRGDENTYIERCHQLTTAPSTLQPYSCLDVRIGTGMKKMA
jgi:hypothetical protein